MLDPRLRVSEISQPLPRLVPWQKGGPLDIPIASLGRAGKKILVRITGGCADMSDEDAYGVLDLVSEAFQGFEGAILIGGTRMIFGKDKNNVLFGITEVGPMIRIQNPGSFVLGVVPRFKFADLDEANNILIVQQKMSAEERPDKRFTTIVHPNQDMVVTANSRLPLTEGRIWDDELAFCAIMMEYVREYSEWPTLTLAYNGGGTTEKELLDHASRGWQTLIVGGSGRKCDVLARDKVFCRQTSVEVCDNNAASLRDALIGLEVIDANPGAGHRHLRAVSS